MEYQFQANVPPRNEDGTYTREVIIPEIDVPDRMVPVIVEIEASSNTEMGYAFVCSDDTGISGARFGPRGMPSQPYHDRMEVGFYRGQMGLGVSVENRTKGWLQICGAYRLERVG